MGLGLAEKHAVPCIVVGARAGRFACSWWWSWLVFLIVQSDVHYWYEYREPEFSSLCDGLITAG
jgi:hypothetical protein